MGSIGLEAEDHHRDAAYNKVLHGKSAEQKGGVRSMLKKDPAAQKAAIEEYFKHWDNKAASTETQEIRDVSQWIRKSRTPNTMLTDPLTRSAKLNMLP